MGPGVVVVKMLFPMIDIEVPPTDYVIRMLPFFKFLLVLEVLLVIGGFVANDFWGALSLAIVCLMGYMCLTGEHGISVTSCLYYTVIAVICGIFDLVRCVMYFQKSAYKCCFTSDAPLLVHVAQAVVLFSPIVEILSGWLTYTFYKDCRRAVEEEPLLPRAERGAAAYRAPGRDAPASRTAAAGGGNDPNFQPFGGQGQRLGNN